MSAEIRSLLAGRHQPCALATRSMAGLLFALLSLGACGMESSSAASAVDRLHRMLAAEKALEYEGMRDLVRFQGSGERRSFFFVQHHANGPTLVESAGRQGSPARRWVERFGRLYWLADKELLLDNYVVAEKGRRTVSGRDGLVLGITSRHAGRPSLEIVVDAERSLLLATEFRDYRGQVAYRSEFHTLLIEPGLPAPPPEREWDGQRRMGDVERVADGSGQALPFSMLEPQYLPDGFVRKSSWKSRRSPRVNTMYSDGLTWIQISLSPAEAGSPERIVKQTRCGSRTSMSMVLNGAAVHLVGHLDPAVLLEVLGSLAGGAET